MIFVSSRVREEERSMIMTVSVTDAVIVTVPVTTVVVLVRVDLVVGGEGRGTRRRWSDGESIRWTWIRVDCGIELKRLLLLLLLLLLLRISE